MSLSVFRIMQQSSPVTIPSRLTFDRSKTISIDMKEIISTMEYLFVAKRFVDLQITVIDNTLLKPKGHLCHESSMEMKGVVPLIVLIQMQGGIQSYQRGWVWI